MTEDALRRLYIEQRDKHLEQLMAVNGRAVFAAIALLASALVSIKDIQEESLSLPWILGFGILFVLGALALLVAAVMMSWFHTGHIRALEAKIVRPGTLQDEDFKIIPPDDGISNPFHFILAGLVLLTLAIIILVAHRMF